jgi:TPP-dependent pyruvate/acetoin dehydrogenase alpha subunit
LSAEGELAVELYRRMLRIRHFEEQVNELYRGGKMPGLAHLYIGEEAVAVGVCAALNDDDYITSTHRGHGHCLAKGAELNPMFAELLGREAGYCHGKGGSMHIADTKRGNLGANAIVAGSAGIATGAALSAKKRGSGQVAVCFFGDGALGQGVLYETMNMASLWRLPVIYVCEDNLYNEYTHFSEAIAGGISSRATAFDIPVEDVDGQNVWEVYLAATRAVARARAREGPTFLNVPLPRPPRRRRRPALLPQQGRGRGLARYARSLEARRRMGHLERLRTREPARPDRRRGPGPGAGRGRVRPQRPVPRAERGHRACLRLARQKPRRRAS